MKNIVFALTFLVFNFIWSCPTGVVTASNQGNGDFDFELTLDFSATTYDSLIGVDWNFGDNSGVFSGNDLNVMHSYLTEANYSITATVKCINSSSDTCTQQFNFSLNYNEVLCPRAYYLPSEQMAVCGNGEINVSWFFCSYEQPNNYWTINSAQWTISDGGSVTTFGYDPLIYTANSSDTLRIVTTVKLNGSGGEVCFVPVYNIINSNILNGNWCQNDFDSINFNSYIDIQPNYYVPFLNSSSLVVCQDENFSLIDYSEWGPLSLGGIQGYNLYLDGDSIYSNTGYPAYGSPFYTSSFDTTGQYTFELVYTIRNKIPNSPFCTMSSLITIEVIECESECSNCNTFKPLPNGHYWISAWVKENHSAQVKSYLESSVRVDFIGISGVIGNVSFSPSGEIIDGWQRIVGSFKVPPLTTDIQLNLVNDNNSVVSFFDDIRVHPFNASMKSYVYDPLTLLLTAELDDNNYATFYEYDKEGQLIRIKKETSRGVMTIQESRSNNPKKE